MNAKTFHHTDTESSFHSRFFEFCHHGIFDTGETSGKQLILDFSQEKVQLSKEVANNEVLHKIRCKSDITRMRALS